MPIQAAHSTQSTQLSCSSATSQTLTTPASSSIVRINSQSKDVRKESVSKFSKDTPRIIREQSVKANSITPVAESSNIISASPNQHIASITRTNSRNNSKRGTLKHKLSIDTPSSLKRGRHSHPITNTDELFSVKWQGKLLHNHKFILFR